MTAPLKNFAEAAQWLGIPESTVRKAVAARKIPHTRIGRHVRFSEVDLEQIVAASRVTPGPSAGVAELRSRHRKSA